MKISTAALSGLLTTCLLFAFTVSFAQVDVVKYTVQDGLASSDVRVVFVDSKDHVWFGTLNGANHFDGTKWTTYLNGSFVEAIMEDSDGNIWMSADDKGLYKFDGDNWTNYNRNNGLSGNDVLCILEDKSGNIWASNWAQGVDRFDGEKWVNFSRTNNGLGSDIINAMIQDEAGNLWFGCEEDQWFGAPGGLTRFDGKKWTNFTTTDGLVSNSVLSLKQDAKNRIWVGTRSGLSSYSDTEWTSYTTVDGLPHNSVMTIDEDKSGTLYFGTYGGGVGIFKSGDWSTLRVDDGLLSNKVFKLAIDKDGQLWVATGEGVSRFDASLTGLESATIAGGFSVYPNPFNHGLGVRFKKPVTTSFHVKLFTATGNQAYSKTVEPEPGGTLLWHLPPSEMPNLSKGNYVIQVSTLRGSLTEHLLKF